jgi:hypothetical protein
MRNMHCERRGNKSVRREKLWALRDQKHSRGTLYILGDSTPTLVASFIVLLIPY